MKSIIAAIAISLVAVSSNADIHSRQTDTNYIKVSKVDAQSVKFELCDSRSDASCKQIGTRSYTHAELNGLRNLYYAKAAGLVAVDAVIGVLLVKVGMWLGPIAFANLELLLFPSHIGNPAGGILGMLVGSVVGPTTGLAGAGFVAVKFLNPVTRIKNARTIRKDTLADRDVKVKGSVADYAKNLEAVLAQLN
jgi:hypothetical protein